MLTITKAPVKGYAEESQDHHVKFSFANRVGDDIKEMFSGVVCRDFLGDCLHAEHIQKPVGIWSFHYDPSKNKIDRDKLRMVISTNKDNAKYLDTIAKNIGLFHAVEQYHNLEATTLNKLDDTFWLLEASSKWLKASYLLSYYTFLVKAASYEYKDAKNWRNELPAMHNKEGRYIASCGTGFDKLTKNLFSICEKAPNPTGFPDTAAIGQIHNNTGFVSTCSGQNEFGKLLKSK